MNAVQGDLLAEAERLRDAGMTRVTEASDEQLIDRIDHVIAALNAGDQDWSANDAREIVFGGDLVGYRPQLIGARVRAAAMRGEQRRVGYTPSTLPSTHAHPIALWRGVRPTRPTTKTCGRDSRYGTCRLDEGHTGLHRETFDGSIHFGWNDEGESAGWIPPLPVEAQW